MSIYSKGSSPVASFCAPVPLDSRITRAQHNRAIILITTDRQHAAVYPAAEKWLLGQRGAGFGEPLAISIVPIRCLLSAFSVEDTWLAPASARRRSVCSTCVTACWTWKGLAISSVVLSVESKGEHDEVNCSNSTVNNKLDSSFALVLPFDSCHLTFAFLSRLRSDFAAWCQHSEK